MGKWLDKEILVPLDGLLMVTLFLLNDLVNDFGLPDWLGGLFIVIFLSLLVRIWIEGIKIIIKKILPNRKLEGE